MSIIDIKNLSIILGDNPKTALPYLEQDKDRAYIKEKTGQVLGVKNANISIKEGEIFVLMGLSGSGKSTLLRAINGLNKISQGTIEINVTENGRDKCYKVDEAEKNELKKLRIKHVAMVFQRFALLPWKNVLENVSFGLEIAHIKRKEREKKALECLKLVGLSNWAKQYPTELSGGMQQRVGLARALATDAQILLMDEPFSALDPLIRSHLQKELLYLQRTLKKTIIFVTHDLDEAINLGNRIAIMQEGNIIQVGSPEEIINKPKTKYVSDFVANIDRTRLLKANMIMTALSKLKRNDDKKKVYLDQNGDYQCIIDAQGNPKKSLFQDKEGQILPWTNLKDKSLSDKDLLIAHERDDLKNMIDALSLSKRPVLVQNEKGKVTGVVTSESIVSALASK